MLSIAVILFLTKELCLLSSSNLLRLVLNVLLDTTTNAAVLLRNTCLDKSVLGLELLCLVDRLVDNTETLSSTTTENGLQTVHECARVVLHLIHSAKLLADLLLGSADGSWVQNLNTELLSSKEGVRHELLGSNDEINHHYR